MRPRASTPRPNRLRPQPTTCARRASADHRPGASCDVEQGVAALNKVCSVQRCNTLFSAFRAGSGCLRPRRPTSNRLRPLPTTCGRGGAQVAARSTGGGGGGQVAWPVHRWRGRCTGRALCAGAVGCGVRPDLVRRRWCSGRGAVYRWRGRWTGRGDGAQVAATVHRAAVVRRRGGLWGASGPCSAAVVLGSRSGVQVAGAVDRSRRRCTSGGDGAQGGRCAPGRWVVGCGRALFGGGGAGGSGGEG
jgi:hypothetical protein